MILQQAPLSIYESLTPFDYVARIKKRSRGRGLVKLRKLLELKRTYPEQPFMKAIQDANQYGLFDLARLENMILKNTSGDYFQL